MSNLIREFLVGIGYRVDRGSEQAATESARRVEREVRAADDRLTRGQVQGSARRVIQANRERGLRTRGAAAYVAEVRAQQRADDTRLKAEERAAEKRDRLTEGGIGFARSLSAAASSVTSVVVGTAAALAGVAVTSTALVEKMASGLERLHYASQRTKSSAGSLQAFGFAASQLGSSAEEAIGAVETLAERIRSSPGYESMLASLGVKTRDEKGGIVEYTEQMAQLGDVLRKMPMHQAKSYAGALGISDTMLAALTSGEFRKNMERYREMLTMAGLKPEEAAAKSKKFMDTYREMQAGLSIVAIKIQSALVDKFGSAIEKFTAWLLKNSDQIATAVIKIGSVLGDWMNRLADLFAAFDKLGPKTRDALIKLAALAAAFLLLNSGPIGAIIAATAALMAFADADTVKRLGELWEKFDALAKKIAGVDGVTAVFGALAAVMVGRVVVALGKVLGLLRAVSSFALSPWLLALLGVGTVAAAATGSAKASEALAKEKGPAAVDPATGQPTESPPMSVQPGNEGWARPYLRRGWNAVKRGLGFGGSAETGEDGAARGGIFRRSRQARERAGEVSPGGIERMGASKGPTTAEGRSNVKSWLEFLQKPRDKGGLSMSEEQARGMVATMQGESGAGLNPRAWNPDDRGLPSGGTAQWRAGRLANLQAFSKANGQDWRTIAAQQTFLRHEMIGSGAYGGGSEAQAYSAIRAAQTRQQALAAGVRRFERPQYPDGEIAKRSGYLRGHDAAVASGNAPAPAPAPAAPAPAAPAPAEPKPPSFQINPEWAPKLSGALSRLNETMNKGEGARVRTALAFQAPPLGDRSVDNSVSKTVSIQTGDTHMQFSGAGDMKAAAETFGATQGRVHADLLRNLKSAAG